MTRAFNIRDKLIKLDDYELIKIIGKGAFGTVFEATEKKTGKSYAVKVVDANDSLLKAKGQKDIIQELTIPFKINFPGIVKLYGFRFPLTEEEKKTEKFLDITMTNEKGKNVKIGLKGAVFVSQLMRNGSLEMITQEYLTTKGETEHMNPTIRSKIIYGVASTMEKIHKSKIIHRDLKLQNIFLDNKHEPRIADFGSSKVILDKVDMTLYVGTPLCMAPELFMDTDIVYSYPVDVYAFAFVIYKMFSNSITFPGKKPLRNQQQYMMKIGNGERPNRPESIPDCYWNLIENCWKQDPDKRPTFSEIKETLRNDTFAINEFDMETDLDELHEYQDRIDSGVADDDDDDDEGDDDHEKEILKPQQKWVNRKNIFNWNRK